MLTYCNVNLLLEYRNKTWSSSSVLKFIHLNCFIQIRWQCNMMLNKYCRVRSLLLISLQKIGRRFVTESKNTQGIENGNNTNLKHLVKQHTKLSRDHMTPEIALFLITKDCEMWSSRLDQTTPFSDPYWAFYWPGGQVLTR